MLAMPCWPVSGLQDQLTPADLEEPLGVDTTRPADVDVSMKSSKSELLLATFGEGPVGITMDHHNGSVVVIEVDVDSQAEAQGVCIGAGVCEVAGRSTEGLDVDGVLKLMLAASRPVVVKFDPPPAGSAKLVPLSSPKRRQDRELVAVHNGSGQQHCGLTRQLTIAAAPGICARLDKGASHHLHHCLNYCCVSNCQRPRTDEFFH